MFRFIEGSTPYLSTGFTRLVTDFERTDRLLIEILDGESSRSSEKVIGLNKHRIEAIFVETEIDRGSVFHWTHSIQLLFREPMVQHNAPVSRGTQPDFLISKATVTA